MGDHSSVKPETRDGDGGSGERMGNAEKARLGD